MIIRQIRQDDAEAFLALCRQLDRETAFMLLEPDERNTTVEQQRERILSVLATDNQMIFVAEHEGRLVGYLAGFGGNYRRNHDNIHIVIGILQAFTGQSIGRRLFETVEAWARERRLHRLELTVMAHNARGKALYTKMGFEVEGVKRESLYVDGAWVDEICMAKLLK
jgi:RimJ/RimL family protein N-acetyltransferase